MSEQEYALVGFDRKPWFIAAQLHNELRESGAAFYCSECSKDGTTVLHARNIADALNHLARRSVTSDGTECEDCGSTLADRYYTVKGEKYCRNCAWHANDGNQPDDDDDNEPPGAGADPYGRPDPQFHPEYWRE